MAEKEAYKEREFYVTRVIRATPEEVFKAWTVPEQIKQWWGPMGYTMPVCEIDLKTGGRILSCMRSPDGRDYWSTGTYREINRPHKLVNTDSFSDEQGNKVPPSTYGMNPDWPMETEQTVTFEDMDGLTKLTVQINVPISTAMRQRIDIGWAQTLDRLQLYLMRIHKHHITAKHE